MAKGKKTGGRKKGVPNKITADLRSMILGALNDVGGQKYLAQQAADNPAPFLAMLGKCLPKDVNLSTDLDGDIVIRFSNGKVQA